MSSRPSEVQRGLLQGQGEVATFPMLLKSVRLGGGDLLPVTGMPALGVRLRDAVWRLSALWG